MPERARQAIRRLAAGLMFLAVLVLYMAQLPFEASGHAHHAHAAYHHLVMAADEGSSAFSAPCSDYCDHHGQATACCVASCTLASAALPTDAVRVSRQADSVVGYHAGAFSSLVGAAPDPALRPPERMG